MASWFDRFAKWYAGEDVRVEDTQPFPQTFRGNVIGAGLGAAATLLSGNAPTPDRVAGLAVALGPVARGWELITDVVGQGIGQSIYDYTHMATDPASWYRVTETQHPDTALHNVRRQMIQSRQQAQTAASLTGQQDQAPGGDEGPVIRIPTPFVTRVRPSGGQSSAPGDSPPVTRITTPFVTPAGPESSSGADDAGSLPPTQLRILDDHLKRTDPGPTMPDLGPGSSTIDLLRHWEQRLEPAPTFRIEPSPIIEPGGMGEGGSLRLFDPGSRFQLGLVGSSAPGISDDGGLGPSLGVPPSFGSAGGISLSTSPSLSAGTGGDDGGIPGFSTDLGGGFLSNLSSSMSGFGGSFGSLSSPSAPSAGSTLSSTASGSSLSSAVSGLLGSRLGTGSSILTSTASSLFGGSSGTGGLSGSSFGSGLSSLGSSLSPPGSGSSLLGRFGSNLGSSGFGSAASPSFGQGALSPFGGFGGPAGPPGGFGGPAGPPGGFGGFGGFG